MSSITNLLIDQLIKKSPKLWEHYCRHDFVVQLINEKLPQEAFSFYLQQDYLFLTEYIKPYAVLIAKSQSIELSKQLAHIIHNTLFHELDSHKNYCKAWGIINIDQLTMSTETLAYTSYLKSTSFTENLLTTLIALAPCMIGYGVIGNSTEVKNCDFKKHHYGQWLALYNDINYQKSIDEYQNLITNLTKNVVINDNLVESLSLFFNQSVNFEIQFWNSALKSIS